MEHSILEPSPINANPTTSQSTQCTNTNQMAHKSSPAPVASTSTNEHPNTTTTTPSPTQTDLRFRCTQCNKGYKTKDILRNHRKEKHSATPSAYKCSQCSIVYTRKYSLDTHLREKHLETPPTYKCTLCDKEFHVKSTFHFHCAEQHFITPITYVCNQCNRQFQSKSGFFYHFKQTHPTTPIVYKFTQCTKLFQSLGKLLRHKKEFHEGAHLSDCANVTSNESTPGLQGQQLESQAEERLFKCTQCPGVFQKADYLSKHTKRMHSNNSADFLNYQENSSVDESINESQRAIPDEIENSNLENPLQVVPKRKRRKTRTKWSRAKQHRTTQARVEPVTNRPENLASTSAVTHNPPQANGQELLVVARKYPCEICGKMLQKGSLNRHRRQVHRSNDMTESTACTTDDSVSGINVQEGIDGQPEIDDRYVINDQCEIYAQPGIDRRDQHGVDGQNGIDYQDENSNQSSISIIEVKSESSQSSNIASFEPALDPQTRQIVFELKHVDQFINHLLSKDSSDDGFTLETLLKEFDKLSPLIVKLCEQCQDHLAEEWMQRKCSLWDEIVYFKKKSLQDDLEHKRKLVMKLIERNENKQLVVEAIEDLKGALDKVQHSQEWDSILLDLRSLYNRLYVQSIKSEFNSNSSKQTQKPKELLPESLKTQLAKLSHLSPNDLENRQYAKLDLLINFLLDVHSHLKSAQALDRLTDEQLQLVQSVVRTKLPLKMSNIFQNDYLSQCNLVPGQACMPLKALCCFCVNWKASNM